MKIRYKKFIKYYLIFNLKNNIGNNLISLLIIMNKNALNKSKKNV